MPDCESVRRAFIAMVIEPVDAAQSERVMCVDLPIFFVLTDRLFERRLSLHFIQAGLRLFGFYASWWGIDGRGKQFLQNT